MAAERPGSATEMPARLQILTGGSAAVRLAVRWKLEQQSRSQQRRVRTPRRAVAPSAGCQTPTPWHLAHPLVREQQLSANAHLPSAIGTQHDHLSTAIARRGALADIAAVVPGVVPFGIMLGVTQSPVTPVVIDAVDREMDFGGSA